MTEEQKAFVAAVRRECTEHYSDGGDIIVECFSDEDIVAEFKSMQDVVSFIGLKVAQELNAEAPGARDRMRRYDRWNDGVQQ